MTQELLDGADVRAISSKCVAGLWQKLWQLACFELLVQRPIFHFSIAPNVYLYILKMPPQKPRVSRSTERFEQGCSVRAGLHLLTSLGELS
jgi:hypothetical protein